VAADADVAVYGEARDDTGFDGGGDLARFEVPVPSGRQYAVEVALRYQSMDIGGSGTSKGSTP
jgi:hypothetical protein